MEMNSLVTMFQEWVWSWIEPKFEDLLKAQTAKLVNDQWDREAHAARMAEMELDIENLQRELRRFEDMQDDPGAMADVARDTIREMIRDGDITVSIDAY